MVVILTFTLGLRRLAVCDTFPYYTYEWVRVPCFQYDDGPEAFAIFSSLLSKEELVFATQPKEKKVNIELILSTKVNFHFRTWFFYCSGFQPISSCVFIERKLENWYTPWPFVKLEKIFLSKILYCKSYSNEYLEYSWRFLTYPLGYTHPRLGTPVLLNIVSSFSETYFLNKNSFDIEIEWSEGNI